MATRNDVTGDALISRTLSKEGEANWDLIFGKKKKERYVPPPPLEDAYEQESRLNRIAEGIEQPDSQAPTAKVKVPKA